MKFNGERPNGFFGQPGPQGFPGQPPGMFPGPAPGGSIRNNLGSGLKSRGVFQKDGQINNLRGGFIGRKGAPVPQGGFPQQGMKPAQGGFPTGTQQMGSEQMQPVPGNSLSLGTGKLAGGSNMGSGPFSFLGSGEIGPGLSKPRQLILQAAQEGFNGNGIATISADNSFSLVANLPPPNNFAGYGYGSSYAVYLVDNKGKTGFLAGILRPVGNGVFQTQFRSQVPLTHYDKVVISLENPQSIGQAPRGPIILKVKEPRGAMAFLVPVKKAGGSVWNKVTGLFRRKPKTPEIPEGGEMPIEEQAPPMQVYPPPVSQQVPQQGYPQVYPPGQQGMPGAYQGGPGNPPPTQ